MKQMNPAHDVTVVRGRNKPYDTFGWGVVFSDATMDNMRDWDPSPLRRWSRRSATGTTSSCCSRRKIRSGGHGFVGIGRKHLLNILQARCEQLDVKLVFETDAQSPAPDANATAC